MSNHGAVMQTYNLELVKYLETLKVKRGQLAEVIYREESGKTALEKSLSVLQEKIKHCDTSLQRHRTLYERYNTVIDEVETGFKKILETSKTLLQVAQYEANKFDMSPNDQSGPI